MEELVRLSDVEALAAGVRAWRYGAAVAVASPGAAGRDRLAIAGDHGDAVTLVRTLLAQVGPACRPLGGPG